LRRAKTAARTRFESPSALSAETPEPGSRDSTLQVVREPSESGSDHTRPRILRLLPGSKLPGARRFDDSAAGELDLIALRGQACCDLLAMVALDLDRAVLRGAACAAVALQVRRDSVEVARREAAHDRHRLAAALPFLAEDPDDAVTRELWSRRLRLTPAALVPVAGRVDEAAVRHVR